MAGKVIVLRPCHLRQEERHGLGQLAVCLEQAAVGGRIEQLLLTVSLKSGEYVRLTTDAVLGILRPNELPEEAKLHLSQVRPAGHFSLRQAASLYTGYCFLADGRFTAGVSLRDEQEAVAYGKLQGAYQHRVLICDAEALAVLEVECGQVKHTAFSMREALDMDAVLSCRASPWQARSDR